MTDNHQEHDLPQINIGDPLYRFLTNRLRFRLRHMMAIWIVFNLVQTVAIPFFHHKNFQSNLFANANIQDVHLWLISFISQPIILYVYWTSVDVTPNVFRSLHDNRVVRPRSHKTAAQFMRDLEARMTSKFYNFLVLALVLVALFLFNLLGWSKHRTTLPIGSYPYNNFQQYVLYMLHGFMRFTFVAWAVGRGLVFIDALRDWWGYFEADIQPFHPDGAGGLGVVGDTSLQAGLMVGAIGLFIGGSIIVNVQGPPDPVELTVLAIMLAGILLIVPFAFILPIWSTHKAMRETRQVKLKLLNDELNTHWGEVYDGQGSVDVKHVDQLSSLIHLRDITLNKMPVWPFGGDDFRRYSLSSLTPLWTVSAYLLLQVILPNVLPPLFGINN